MLPVLTMSNIESHESFFKNDFFGVSSSVESTPLNDNVRVLTIGVVVFESEEVKAVIESKLNEFVHCHNIDNGSEYDTFIFDSSKFGFLLHHCAVDLEFNLELINNFFINLVDELNTVFGD